MLKETGRIVDITEGFLWLETIKRSTCGSCVAEKGCGQTLLQKLGAKPTYLRVSLNEHSTQKYKVNDLVSIGIPDDIIVKGSLLLYLLPLVFLLVFSGSARIFTTSEAVSILAGLIGFVLGCLLIRYHSFYYRNDKRHQAYLVEDDVTQKININ